jgi:hypothetical protein
MPTVTAPFVETQQVVTGFMYQLHIAEADGGRGITRLDIGPYRFPGTPPIVKYPEAVTNEMCLAGWNAIHWDTDEMGQSWLRWQGGTLEESDGEQIFQMTSNYPPTSSGASLYVYRRGQAMPEKFSVPTPDYSVSPPQINPRHDVAGQGKTFVTGTGCAPALALILAPAAIAAVRMLLG